MKSDAPKPITPRTAPGLLGFASGFRFASFVVFGGALFLFCLLHLQWLDYYGYYCGRRALPGECFYFLRWKPAEIGMLLHLWCVIPAGILAVVQFIPVVRCKAPRLHRVNGYVTMILDLVGAAAAVPTIPHAFGGGLVAESATWILVAAPITAQIKAYIEIKKRRIAQHRAWMLRAWSIVRASSPRPLS